jgi:phospholipid/cholesterol/gamma-HCH transport system permease protein
MVTEAAHLRADIQVAGSELRCQGDWTVDRIHPLDKRLLVFPWPEASEVVVDGSGVHAMDTAGVWLLWRAVQELERRGRKVTLRLQPEHEGLLLMVRSSGVGAVPLPQPEKLGWLGRIGHQAWVAGSQVRGLVEFVGENAVVAARSLAEPRRVRWRPVLHNVQTAGFNALPITGLLSFLMGIVIAYQGAAQLRRYGASIFVADLVGLAMLRELSPLLTAIIVAGRSGSAYAAQIGTMKVTEEIDALRTVGVVPIELLVLPKIAALTIALPLLTVYADVLGVAGGMIMAKSELAVGYQDFIDRFVRGVGIGDYLVGVGKAPVFAAIIAVVGCYQGFQVSGDAESVGRRTTVSVVHSIFLVIVVDALFSVVFSSLGI